MQEKFLYILSGMAIGVAVVALLARADRSKGEAQGLSANRWLVVAGAIVLLLWCFWGLAGVHWTRSAVLKSSSAQNVTSTVESEVEDKKSSELMAELGQTGDLFGGFNALISAFAFIGVFVAAYYQRQSWRLQQEQNQRTHEAHVRESFEPIFFKLLERQEQLKPQELKIPNWNTGSEVKKLELKEACDIFRRRARWGPVQITARSLYEDLYELNGPALGRYMRAVYITFEFVLESKLPREWKFKYAKIARAELSTDEALLFAVNSLLYKEVLPVIGAFSLLRHCTLDDQKFALELKMPETAAMSSKNRTDYWRQHPSSIPNQLLTPSELELRKNNPTAFSNSFDMQ